MTTVTTEIIRTELATYYKVSRVFPNAESAARGVAALEAIGSEAPEPECTCPGDRPLHLPCPTHRHPPASETQEAALAAITAQAQRLGLYDDDYGAPGEPPRCNANGSCE